MITAGFHRRLLFALALCPLTTFAQYRADSWTVEEGLPQNSVRSICQTADGYLWLATFDGLARFDGVRFTVFDKSNTPGIESNRFVSLYLDPAGDLWAGTENGGVTRRHGGVFTTYTTEHGLPNNFVTGITSDPAGNLWVVSDERIMRWDNGRFAPAQGEGLDGNFRAAIWNPQAFFGVDETRLRRFAHGQLTALTLPRELPGSNIIAVGEDHAGDVWISTRDRKIARFEGGKLASLVGPVLTSPDPRTGTISDSRMQISYRDRQRHPWTMTLDPNLTRILTFLSSGQPASIPFDALFEDREGNIWLGTDGQGLYCMRQQSITVYSKQRGLVAQNAYPIYEDRFGAIWIGAWTSGLSRFKDGAFTNFTGRDGLLSGTLTAITEDREGRIWVAGIYDKNGGLQVLDNRGAAPFGPFAAPGVQIPPGRTNVAAIHQDGQGTIWLGTTRGLVRVKDGAATSFATEDGLAGGDVRAIIEARGGGLWIGAYGGLTRYQDGRLTGWTERDGLPSNSIRALYEDREGVLWIGTSDGGLGRFEGGRFTRYTTRDGLFNNGVFQILEDGRGNLWMSSNRGIYRASKQELNDFAAGRRRTVTSVAYGKSDGMLSEECNGGFWPAGIKAGDGRLWFPTQDGVAVIDPEAVPVNREPPAVLIESFLLDREAVAFDRQVRVPPGKENFEIHYTALSFVNPERISFKYRLEGLDREWVEAGARRTAYYSHVPPGEYTFRVIAANSDGVWNEEGRGLRVEVLPPFYRTWWFLALAAAGVAGAAWVAVRYRIRQLEREKAAQRAFSRRLIESQEQERKRIATGLHDSLGQQLLVIKNWALIGLGAPDRQDQTRMSLGEISDTASQSIDEVREVIYNLRPYQLDKIGLAKTISFMVERVAAASGIAFRTELGAIDRLLPAEDEVTLYRVVQECVNNVIKHSGATAARVSAGRDGRALSLTVEDNGRGFAPNGGGRRGLGLTSMGERVRMLGGRQTIESTPGGGTRIQVVIELPEGDRAQTAPIPPGGL